jgi:galactokinase
MGFADLHGGPPEFTARSAGRVNLLGEHTDYNDGLVLPAPIPQQTAVSVRRRPDRLVRVGSSAFPGDLVGFELGAERRANSWVDYVAGVTRILADAGYEVSGADLFLESEVPLGSGLSSSAALGVAVLRAFRRLGNLDLDDVVLARLWQRVENEFIGAAVGVMDPMSCSVGDVGHALFLDCRSMRFERVKLPAGAGLIVIHSGVSHQHDGGDYNHRVRECAEARARLGVESLRDLSPADLPRINDLPEPLAGRARHVVTENERVLAGVRAIRQGDLVELGRLLTDSHRSQRNDYGVSVPAIDTLVETALTEPGVFGARLTGGGFGGSIVALAKLGDAPKAGRSIAERYRQATGHEPRVLVP